MPLGIRSAHGCHRWDPPADQWVGVTGQGRQSASSPEAWSANWMPSMGPGRKSMDGGYRAGTPFSFIAGGSHLIVWRRCPCHENRMRLVCSELL
jgi:hypothetical protein